MDMITEMAYFFSLNYGKISKDIFLHSLQYLEPLYDDFRKIRYMDKMGKLHATNVDQFVDELMTSERACDIILPRLQQRHVLEELGDVCLTPPFVCM